MQSVLWFRRDLRLSDNPALVAAAGASDTVTPLFVIDPALWDPAGPVRRAYLVRSLRALRASTGGHLLVRYGDPRSVVPQVAQDMRAREVHCASDYGPYGARRDSDVRSALRADSRDLVRTGSAYAVAPGRVTKDDETPYRVYTPYYRAWVRHGWRRPAGDAEPAWRAPAGDELPDEPDLGELALPPAGEAAALERWHEFRASGLESYADQRDRADLDGTSRLSHHLKWGEIHPRTLLADLGDSPGEEVFRKEIAWREFYADVLWHSPRSARESLDRRYDGAMDWDEGPSAEALLDTWAQGRTGFPFVDAGMRQLRAEGWVHNRVRMVVASFLVKDLHLPWQRGAREFMHWLRDADLASNQHGWQWTAGSGTDASPYHRVFNPVSQGIKFDPTGDYVRRYIPELRHLAGKSAHEPWRIPGGYDHGYPQPIVDHAVERLVALERYERMKDATAR